MSGSSPRQLSIVTFIDALGWEVLKGRSFMEEELTYRQPLRSVFGFSSACVPSILTGLQPRDHKHWSFFYKAGVERPFRHLRWLKLLPSSVTDRGRVRSKLSKHLAKWFGYTGYFQLYNIPFKHIDKFDYCEKQDLFKAGGMNNGENIFERLETAGVPYSVSNWRESESANLTHLESDIKQGDIKFAFLYMADMDGLLHRVGKDSKKVDEKLAWYEPRMQQLLATAREHYDEVRLFVCSDHGMATVTRHVDIMSKIEALPYKFGGDYLATYDSTMARFWFNDPAAEAAIRETLEACPEGKILSKEELVSLGCDFEGDQYGELIYLVDAGTIILPSHMGTTPITGMHGYHPDHPDSDASLLSNVPPPGKPACITDVFDLMASEAGA